MNKWWKIGIILGLTIIAITLAIIFMNDLVELISSILAALGLGTAAEVYRRQDRVTPNTVSNIPSDRTVLPNEPDSDGFVQLVPSVEDTSKNDIPEGITQDSIDNTIRIIVEPNKEEDQEKPETTNHFTSRLTRGSRKEKMNE